MISNKRFMEITSETAAKFCDISADELTSEEFKVFFDYSRALIDAIEKESRIIAAMDIKGVVFNPVEEYFKGDRKLVALPLIAEAEVSSNIA